MSYASDIRKFIYVRVPRTGSGTFCTYLMERFGDELVDVGAMHEPATRLRELWGEKWDQYFTFGYIRNPWDWMVSVYNSGISCRLDGKGLDGVWPGAKILPEDAPGIHPGQRMNMTFKEWLGRTELTPLSWLTDREGTVMVDEIRRFEDFIGKYGKKRAVNAMPHRPFKEWYDEEGVEIVRAKCAQEIAIGGYSW